MAEDHVIQVCPDAGSSFGPDPNDLTQILESREAELLAAFARIANGSYTDPETPRAIARDILRKFLPVQFKT